MGKLLLVAPEHVGIIDVVLEGMQQYSGHTVDFLDLHLPKYKYKSFNEKAYNFFLKNFRGKNIKKDHYDKVLADTIHGFGTDRYDIIVIIRPDLLTDKVLDLLRSKTDYFVSYYWDTVEFYRRKEKIMPYFDKIFSFDPHDCKKYGFEFLSNFYYYEEPAKEIAYEVYNISNFDAHRNKILERISRKLESFGITYCFKMFYKKPVKSRFVTNIPKLLPYREMLKDIAAAHVILEVQKKSQRGLTFRPFEALGLNKKLITTNAEIRNYDFFDEENILVLDYEDKDVKIPRSFFEKPYKELPKERKEKYHLKNWVHTLINK